MIFALEGKEPIVHETAFVAPTAAVIGDVVIAEDCGIWFGAVLRGDVGPIRIGAGTNVQDNVIMHDAVEMGRNCHIAHRAIVHRCRLGENVLVGAGAVVFDECEIGDQALIGIGAVVTPGTKVPSRTLWTGIPARQVREMDQEEVQRRLRGYLTYIGLKNRYQAREGLRLIR